MKTRLAFILLSLILTVSCTREAPVSGKRQTMQVSADIDTHAERNDSEKAVFLFWRTGDYGRIGTNYLPQPYLECVPPNSIDSYGDLNAPYDTQENYPSDAQFVVATGYYPNSLERTMVNGRVDYSKVSLPIADAGRTDILSVVVPKAGSSLYPFNSDPAKKLHFRHVQSRINFQAGLSPNFPKTKYLRDIRILIPGVNEKSHEMQFVGGLEWKKGDVTVDPETVTDIYDGDEITVDRYVPFPLNTELMAPDAKVMTVTLQDSNHTQLDPDEGNRHFDPLYIRPGLRSIYFGVIVTISDDVTFPDDPLATKEVMYTALEVPFLVNNDDTDPANDEQIALQESDSYDITLLIDDDKIALVGRKAEWIPGGYITIPIYPYPNN